MQLPPLLSLIGQLVAQPSVSSYDPQYDQSNLPVVHLLAEWAETLGFAVSVQQISPSKANLLAVLGDAVDRNGLVLSGHTDTVPYDAGQWHSDPFCLSERGHRLYGLGVADMKAFFALALSAAAAIDRKQIQRPLVLLATADEESSMSGVKWLVQQQERPGRYAVIGEPTRLRPVRMHKGVMSESLCVHGHAGHASDPALGANAIEGMHAVIGDLLAWREELQQRHHHAAFSVPTPTLNLGAIHGGDNSNRICARCQTDIDIRLLPGMMPAAVREELRRRLAQSLKNQPRLRLECNALFEGLPPFETPADAPLVHACEHFSGHAAEAVAFGTEAPYLSSLGLETLVLGPGDIAQAHQPDEYLALAQLQPGIDIYRQLIERFCLHA
ncbi:MAG: acetylornithine deacetylase [Methylococcaceae bacterium]|nr:MAG: acetylornithine deacetylase [Methylococcaceae bacterium]